MAGVQGGWTARAKHRGSLLAFVVVVAGTQRKKHEVGRDCW